MPTEATPNSPPVFNYIFNPSIEQPPDRAYYANLLGEGDLGIWIGREKHRKTAVGLQLAFCAALAKNFLNFRFCAGGPLRVVIFDWESKGGSLKRRYDALCRSMELTDSERQRLQSNLHIVEFRRYVADGKLLPKFPVKRNAPTPAEYQEALQFWKNLVTGYPADLYIIDPMRCLHAQDENDSSIEELLAMIRRVFGKSAVIIAHHMTKRGNPKDSIRLKDDMRAWSDGARGSGAIKAHADVIICQEREITNGEETVFWGAFLKDAADIEPLPLTESDVESFHWEVSQDLPPNVKAALAALTRAGGPFKNKSEAAAVVEQATPCSRPTAFRHIAALVNYGLLVEEHGRLALAMPLKKVA
jgi:hypothetical protein